MMRITKQHKQWLRSQLSPMDAGDIEEERRFVQRQLDHDDIKWAWDNLIRIRLLLTLGVKLQFPESLMVSGALADAVSKALTALTASSNNPDHEGSIIQDEDVMDRVVDFFANEYDESSKQDALKHLTEVTKSRKIAKKLLDSRAALRGDDVRKFHKPEVGDRHMRETIKKWVSARVSASAITKAAIDYDAMRKEATQSPDGPAGGIAHGVLAQIRTAQYELKKALAAADNLLKEGGLNSGDVNRLKKAVESASASVRRL